MQKLKVFIVEDNVELCNSIALSICNHDEFEVVGIAYNGAELLKTLQSVRPDILILDIVLPIYDGLYLIEHIKEHYMNYMPVIVIISGLSTDILSSLAKELNIYYYFSKPIDTDNFISILKKIAELFKSETKPEVDEQLGVISDCLSKIGIPVHLSSYKYLKDAVSICLNDEEYLELVTKVLYPAVAKINKVKAERVQRSIRYGINVAKKKNNDYFQKVFSGDTQKLTSSTFLKLVVEHLKPLL